jgi:rod shape-determining protein MreB
VHDCDDGVVFDEPSVIAISPGRRRAEPIAMGAAAETLAERAPDGLTVARPVEHGAVRDLDLGRAFLHAILNQLGLRRWQRRRLRVAFAVPVGASPLERRALQEIAREAQLRQVGLVPAPVAGAVGCGVDPMLARTGIVVDVGGGTAEMVAFCYGGVLTQRSCRIAGDELTTVLCTHLREHHRLLVGRHDAQQLKHQLCAPDCEPSLIVSGRDAGSGRAQLVTVPVEELLETIRPVAELIAAVLASALDELPPRGLDDVNEDGVLLVGGGCLLPGLPKLIEQLLGFPVRSAAHPFTCVAQGAAECLQRPELLAAFAA